MYSCAVCGQTINLGQPTSTDSHGRKIHAMCWKSQVIRKPWQP
jgi:hypothetical protein